MPIDPDDVERETLDRHRLLQLLEHTVGDPQRDVLARQVGQHDPELVAAEPRHQVVVAQHARQPRPDLLQQQVAEVVTERVVDLLEVIEVHQHHGHAAVGRARVLDLLAAGVDGRTCGWACRSASRAAPGTRSRPVSPQAHRWPSAASAFVGTSVVANSNGARKIDDREAPELLVARDHEHAEEREAHVGDQELAEHARVDLAGGTASGSRRARSSCRSGDEHAG